MTTPSDSGRKTGAGGGGNVDTIDSRNSDKQSSEVKNNTSKVSVPRSSPHSAGHPHDSRGDTHNDEEDCGESSTARNVQKITTASPMKDGSTITRGDGSISRVNYSTTTGPTNYGDSTVNNADDLNDSNGSVMNCTDNTFNNTLSSLDSRQHRIRDNNSDAGNEPHTRGDRSPSPSPSPSPAKGRFTQFKVPPLTMHNPVLRNRSEADMHYLGILYKKNSTGEQ